MALNKTFICNLNGILLADLRIKMPIASRLKPIDRHICPFDVQSLGD